MINLVRRLRIGLRLRLAFGALLLLATMSTGVAVSRMAKIEEGLDDIVKSNNVQLRLSHEMSESVHVVARVIRSAVLLHDPGRIAAEAEKIARARADYDKALVALVKMADSPEGLLLREGIAAAAAAARPLNTQVLDMALANKDEEAVKLLMDKAAPATQAWQDAIDQYLAHQERDSELRYAVAQLDYKTARNAVVVLGVASLLVAVGLAWLVTLSIVDPLSRAKLAVGAVASGDLTVEIDTQGQDEAADLLRSLRMMTDNLVVMAQQVRGGAESVATASHQIAQGNFDLSSRTEQQASALEETAASMEQLGSTVKQNAENARQASQFAQSASAVAVRGGEVVSEVVATMKGINDSSRQIAEIIGVIDAIAFQTNILALNAAVESARAGEQGRGFAVVASEVRGLAQRCAQAAQQIKGLITDSVERVEKGSEQVQRAGATMSEVVAAVRRVSDIMGEISAASTEQSAGVSQVGEAVTQMDQVTQQNAALVEESAAAAESLKVQATQLVSAVAVFRIAGNKTGMLA